VKDGIGRFAVMAENRTDSQCEISDQQLLARFVAHQDESAFSRLLQRHARIVYSVCRRVLPQEQDAEDAFQAVFLALARNAGSIRQGTAVGSWLYSVAYRTSLKARTIAYRRAATEKQAASPANVEVSPSSEAACRELQHHLDEEVDQLPEKYRAPFVLCCLEGMSKSEAAKELGWKEGTVSGRLARARKLLQNRLARRGFTLSAALTATALAYDTAWAQAPAALVQATPTSVLGTQSSLSPLVRNLADAMQRSMAPTRLRWPIPLAAAALVCLIGAGLIALLWLLEPAHDTPIAVEPDTFLAPPVALGTPADEQVATVAFSPDGTRLITAGGRGLLPGQLKIWDVKSAKELHSIGGIPGVRSAAYSPTAPVFATGDAAGTIKLRDADTGDEKAQVRAHAGAVLQVAFARDGKLLASVGADGAKLWTADALLPRTSFVGHSDKILAVAFFGNHQNIVTASLDRTAKIWDIETGKNILTLVGHEDAIDAVAVSPDDRWIATASADKTVRIWDAKSGTPTAVLESNVQAFHAVAFSADANLLASAGRDGMIRLWDVKTLEPAGTLGKHSDSIWTLAFSRDGVLASGSADRTVKLWRPGGGNRPIDLATSWAALRPVRAVAYAPDGRRLAVATPDTTVHLRETTNGDIVQVLHGHRAPVACLAYSSDGQMLASASEDGMIKLWNRDGGEIHTLTNHVGAIYAIAFTPDSAKLASAGNDQMIRLWDCGTGTELAKLAGHTGAIRALAIAPDGQTLFSGGDDRTIKIWNLPKRTAIQSLDGHTAPVRALAYASNGVLASGSDDATVKLWNFGEPAARLTLVGHTGPVLALAFTPQGTTLVSAGNDKSIRVWNPADGQPRGVLIRHSKIVTSLAMHPFGHNLISGSHDTLLLRWQAGRIPPPEPGR